MLLYVNIYGQYICKNAGIVVDVSMDFLCLFFLSIVVFYCCTIYVSFYVTAGLAPC